MAELAKFIPDDKTLFYATQAGSYRCHNGRDGGLLVFDVERALKQEDFEYIDCFPTFGGPCSLQLVRDWTDNTWYTEEELDEEPIDVAD